MFFETCFLDVEFGDVLTTLLDDGGRWFVFVRLCRFALAAATVDRKFRDQHGANGSHTGWHSLKPPGQEALLLLSSTIRWIFRTVPLITRIERSIRGNRHGFFFVGAMILLLFDSTARGSNNGGPPSRQRRRGTLRMKLHWRGFPAPCSLVNEFLMTVLGSHRPKIRHVLMCLAVADAGSNQGHLFG
jgi:hypothetical protein